MLLENVGIRMEIVNPIDIEHLKSLGWKEVKLPKPEKAEEQPAEKQGGKKAVKNG